MKPGEIQKLLGGYATGTLSEQERQILFDAALDDQALFNALADEQVLRDYLQDPAFKRQLAAALEPKPGPNPRSWFRSPAVWGLAGSLAAGMLVFVVVHRPVVRERTVPERVEMARREPEAPAATVLPAPPAASKLTAPRKRLAVIDFNSGKSKPELGQSVSSLVNDRLASSGVYTVVKREEVKRAMKKQDGSNRALDPAQAANIGRSLGADAVVVGNVTSTPPAGGNVAVTANMIDSKTGQSFAMAKANSGPSGGAQSLRNAADSIGSQLERRGQTRVEGQVTEIDGEVLTINVGAAGGVKTGDRLQIRRGAEPIGQISITASGESSATGKYTGRTAARVGDAAIAERD